MTLPQLPSGEEVIEGFYREVSSEYGALVIYLTSQERGSDVKCREVRPFGDFTYYSTPRLGSSLFERELHANVVERKLRGETIFAAAFPRLKEGEYWVTVVAKRNDSYQNLETKASVYAGLVAEVDWR